MWLWLALLLALLQAPLAQALEASVDRALVSEGDSLTLTIRRSGRDGSGAPDYSPLETDFHLLGSSQSSRSVITSGRAEAWTEWQITLVPRRSGQLTLPSLSVGGERTAPIRIDVQPARAAANGQARDPVFIEVTVDSERVYVEQQLLLTVRVFHALALEDMELSDPEPEHARVTKVSQTHFRRDIDGVTYQVHELVYAIFAGQPGELVIPELVFSGRQPLRSRALFDFPGQGRALRRMSRPLSVAIKPIPAGFSGTTWLPARNLALVESWNGNPEQLVVGESMTRSLTLQADGIDGAHLPELPLPTIDGGRLYADQPQLDDSSDARGIRGKRVHSAALIPSRPGPLQLPGARLLWWDVDSDSEKVAEIAPHRLQIRPAAAGATDTSPATAQVDPARAGSALPGAAPDHRQLLGWQIATTLLACGWLATLLWSRRRPRPLPTPRDAAPALPNGDEAAAFKALQRACRERQPASARGALLAWGAAAQQRQQVGLEELLQWADDSALNGAVTELERRLYAPESSVESTWHGETLLAAVEAVRERRPKSGQSAAGGALPPLYPLR